MFIEHGLTWGNIEKHIYKKHHVTKNMYYCEWRMYENIYKRISVQYNKHVTSNISVHESSPNTMERDEAKTELPVEIREKLLHTLLESESWHQDVEKVCTTAPTGTQEEKAKEEELKKRKVQDDASGIKSY